MFLEKFLGFLNSYIEGNIFSSTSQFEFIKKKFQFEWENFRIGKVPTQITSYKEFQ